MILTRCPRVFSAQSPSLSSICQPWVAPGPHPFLSCQTSQAEEGRAARSVPLMNVASLVPALPGLEKLPAAGEEECGVAAAGGKGTQGSLGCAAAQLSTPQGNLSSSLLA